jgi:hypothetical protein
MIDRIKRYFFWLVIEDQYEDWEDFWRRVDSDGHFKFKAWFYNKSVYNDWGRLSYRDRLGELTEYFKTTYLNNFEAKYHIWKSKK